jgi:hypothetical protein
LLDHRFAEMAVAPASVKLDHGSSKRIFKDALRPWIPTTSSIARSRVRGPGQRLASRPPDLPKDVLLIREQSSAASSGPRRCVARSTACERAETSKRIWLLTS